MAASQERRTDPPTHRFRQIVQSAGRGAKVERGSQVLRMVGPATPRARTYQRVCDRFSRFPRRYQLAEFYGSSSGRLCGKPVWDETAKALKSLKKLVLPDRIELSTS